MYQSFAIAMKGDQNEIWFVDLPIEIFKPYVNEGCSVVGSPAYLLEEIRNFLDGADV